jgi:hypothetical protein
LSDRDETDNIQPQKLLDLFEGAKGRRPKTDQELDEWLASPEGKAAMAFELTSASRWGRNGTVITAAVWRSFAPWVFWPIATPTRPDQNNDQTHEREVK